MNSIVTPYNPIKAENISPKGKLHGRTYTYADLAAGHVRKREMPLKGFDPHYGSLVDYILRCTYDIWERKNTGQCMRHYAEVGEIYTPMGYGSHVMPVIEDTTRTLQAFPDRELYSVNIIWDGNEDEGYLSSHLIRTIMTSTQTSVFGPANGAKIDIYGIADCLCRENLIVKEWLIRDNASLVRQLGLKVEQVAWDNAVTDYQQSTTHWWEEQTQHRQSIKQPLVDVVGRPNGNTDGGDASQVVLNMLNDVWRAKYYGMVDDYYSYNVQIHGCGGQELIGTRHLKTFLTHFYGGLDNADFVVEHTQSTPSNAGDNETFVHVRWSITATHGQSHMYGPGTGCPLYVMGISQYRVVDGRICEEWIIYDEVAVWKQIHLHAIRNNPAVLEQDS